MTWPSPMRLLMGALIGAGLFVASWFAGSHGQRAIDWARHYSAERRARTIATEEWGSLVTGSRLGSDGALPVLVEFSDYECPYCRRADRILDSILPGSGVTVVYRHLPLREIHPAAEGAARTAICADAQGRFLEVHARLMTTTSWQRDTAWGELAHASGVQDLPAFLACRTSQATTDRLSSDELLAARLAVGGTPTFFYRRGRYTEELTRERLQALSP